MHKNVLVTLADKNYLDQAKQVFSSAYWNAGWDGDYLLLAHEGIPEKNLAWFKEKGTIIHECKALTDKNRVGLQHPPVVLDKFYLFTPYFKQWKHVLFIDGDAIVEASLRDLTKVKGFAAGNAHWLNLKKEFVRENKNNREIWKILRERYDLSSPALNPGVMAFDTSVITADSLAEMLDIYSKFEEVHLFGEEATFNLYFYRKWQILPIAYNTYPQDMWFFGSPYKKVDGVILHFCDPQIKPWTQTSIFYPEWKENLRKADAIDLRTPQTPKETATPLLGKYRYPPFIPSKMLYWYRKIEHNVMNIASLADRLIGAIGRSIRKKNPALHRRLKKILYG